MKNFYGIFMGWLLCISYSSASGQGLAINSNHNPPNPSSGMDIDFSNKGLLLPRVSLSSTADVSTIPSPATSLMVYNTNASMTGGSVGYWYWTGTAWSQISTGLSNETNLSEVIANFEDFVFDAYAGAGQNDNQYSFTQSVQNGGSSDCDGNGLYSGGYDYMGLHILNTGTSASGRAGIGSFNFIDKYKFGSQRIVYEARVRVEALSDALQTFTCYYGMGDFVMASGSMTAGNAANGIYFTYTHGTNSGKWVGVTRSANTSTNVNSNVAVLANHWYKLKIVINAAGTQVDFYVDDAFVGTSSSNIPTANPVKMVFKMEKTVGTVSRTSSIDYVVVKMIR